MKGNFIKVRISAVLGVCLTCVFLLTSCQGGKIAASLDIGQMRKDGMFCYPGLEWGSSKEDVEDNTGLTFKNKSRSGSIASENYLEARNIQLFGEEGAESYHFTKGKLKAVFINFGSEEGKEEINEFSEKLIEDLEEYYGPWEEQEENPYTYWGGKMGMRSFYQWQYILEDGTKSRLSVVVVKDKKKDTNLVQIQLQDPGYPDI